MNKDDGGPAFPAKDYIVPQDLEARHVHALGKTQGMSLRDYFAAAALQGIVSKKPFSEVLETRSDAAARNEATVRGAYAYADAMIAERAK